MKFENQLLQYTVTFKLFFILCFVEKDFSRQCMVVRYSVTLFKFEKNPRVLDFLLPFWQIPVANSRHTLFLYVPGKNKQHFFNLGEV